MDEEFTGAKDRETEVVDLREARSAIANFEMLY